MEQSAQVLVGASVSIAFVHTLIGVDHTLPFVVLARAQKWSARKLWLVTGLCGLGHVMSSIVLGFVGIGVGVALNRLEWVEAYRGGLAAWLLIGFGLSYASWALYRSLRGRVHAHVHVHEDGTVHDHDHQHVKAHAHAHSARRQVTIWALFLIFVFGPCEPLIPLVMVPSFEHQWWVVAAVVGAFTAVTIGTMLAVVTLAYYGLQWRGFGFLERHVHVFAGVAIAASGVAIQVLGI